MSLCWLPFWFLSATKNCLTKFFKWSLQFSALYHRQYNKTLRVSSFSLNLIIHTIAKRWRKKSFFKKIDIWNVMLGLVIFLQASGLAFADSLKVKHCYCTRNCLHLTKLVVLITNVNFNNKQHFLYRRGISAFVYSCLVTRGWPDDLNRLWELTWPWSVQQDNVVCQIQVFTQHTKKALSPLQNKILLASHSSTKTSWW